jgi:hypothetical protein
MTTPMIGSAVLVLGGVLAILGGSALGFRAWRFAEHDAQTDQVVASRAHSENIALKTRVSELEMLLVASRAYLERAAKSKQKEAAEAENGR